MAHITPTIGRIVYLRPGPDTHCEQIADKSGFVTHAAMVAHVHEDGTLNLAAVDSDAKPYQVWSVPLVQDGDPVPAPPFAYWMPYQAKQAERLRGDGGLTD